MTYTREYLLSRVPGLKAKSELFIRESYHWVLYVQSSRGEGLVK